MLLASNHNSSVKYDNFVNCGSFTVCSLITIFICIISLFHSQYLQFFSVGSEITAQRFSSTRGLHDQLEYFQ